jgi:hypothetical protein
VGDNASILKIPVDASEFEKFMVLFDKYRDELAQTPEAYNTAQKSLNAMATQAERLEAAHRKFIATLGDQEEGDTKRLNRWREMSGIWNNISTQSSHVSKNLLDIGSSMLKWGSLIGGGALLGSMFGLDRLAHSVGDTRSTALGYSVSPAALQAFNVNFGKVMDTQGFLSSMTTMESDVTNRRAW